MLLYIINHVWNRTELNLGDGIHMAQYGHFSGHTHLPGLAYMVRPAWLIYLGPGASFFLLLYADDLVIFS